MKRRFWRWLAPLLLVSVIACTQDSNSTTSLAVGSTASALEVADAFVTAMSEGDYEEAAALTFLEQMPWVVMAEGGSLSQAASLEGEDLDMVAANYWRGFAQAAQLPQVAGDEVDETSVGGRQYAVVPLGSRLRLVLRDGEEWQVDVIASFAPTIVNRLLEAAEVVEANRGSLADRMRELLASQRPSVELASVASGLPERTEEDMAALLDLLDDLSEET